MLPVPIRVFITSRGLVSLSAVSNPMLATGQKGSNADEYTGQKGTAVDAALAGKARVP